MADFGPGNWKSDFGYLVLHYSKPIVSINSQPSQTENYEKSSSSSSILILRIVWKVWIAMQMCFVGISNFNFCTLRCMYIEYMVSYQRGPKKEDPKKGTQSKEDPKKGTQI